VKKTEQKPGNHHDTVSETEKAEDRLVEERAFYNRFWSEFEWVNALQLHRLVAILSEISRAGIERPAILELGCGTGWMTSVLGMFGPATGIDLSDTGIEFARSSFLNAEFLRCDIQNIDSLESQFDVVVSHEVIEHLSDQARHVSVSWDHLQPGGFLILTTPNGRILKKMPPEEQNACSSQPREKYLEKRELARLLRDRGFQRIMISSVTFGVGRGVLSRIITVPSVRYRLWKTGLDAAVDGVAGRLGCGLHLVASAMKPP
jgi:2-polyprenyl-3-methyl-5-hydroxy-6-metoxy-1,4-benzoquinol methylase